MRRHFIPNYQVTDPKRFLFATRLRLLLISLKSTLRQAWSYYARTQWGEMTIDGHPPDVYSNQSEHIFIQYPSCCDQIKVTPDLYPWLSITPGPRTSEKKSLFPNSTMIIVVFAAKMFYFKYLLKYLAVTHTHYIKINPFSWTITERFALKALAESR